MAEDAGKTYLNLGCGLKKALGPEWINVDAYASCDPDLVWDLNKTPFPWKTNSIDHIYMSHSLEHVKEWWPCFTECARILKPGALMEIRVPDESSRTALTYRDHFHVFSRISFHGIKGQSHGTSAWAIDNQESVPLEMVSHHLVPHKQYNWMIKWCPWLLKFCGDHLRNFIHEQVFVFRKIGDRNE